MTERALTELIIGIVCAVLLVAAWFWHDHAEREAGETACMQATSETKTAAELAAVKATDTYQDTVKRPAEAIHAAEVSAIAVRTIRVPLVLHDGALCPDALHAEGSVAGQLADPGAGGAVEGPGSGLDIRPSLEAFKAKYETILADYRQLNIECRSNP